MPTGSGSRPTFSCSRPRSSRYISFVSARVRVEREVRSISERIAGAHLSVRTVLHHDDHEFQPMTLDGLERLHLHHQAAVAVEQHDGSIRTRRRDPHGERDAVADRAELADGEELLLWTRRHLREKP